MDDQKVGICEFKKKWDEYLQRVKEGETIIITSYGKPMAQMAPATSTDKQQPHEEIEAIE